MIKKIQISKYRKLFLVLAVLYFIYFLFFLPEIILNKCMDNPKDKFWNTIDDFVHDVKALNFIRSILFNKIADTTIMPAIYLNAVNMVYGFINYKKKWWYYMILAVSILLSVILRGHYVYELEIDASA